MESFHPKVQEATVSVSRPLHIVDFNPIFGLGYDLVNNDYKVIRIHKFLGKNYPTEVWVFSLASNSWRLLEISNFNGEKLHGIYSRSRGVFALGALHWLSSTNKRQQEIVTFDVSKEVFLPIVPSIQAPIRYYKFSLEVLNPEGRLFLCGKDEKFSIILFEIMKNGECFALKQMHKIDVDSISNFLRIPSPNYQELLSMDKDKILFHTYCKGFGWYGLKMRSYEKVNDINIAAGSTSSRKYFTTPFGKVLFLLVVIVSWITSNGGYTN
ncbi:hypothetical protein COLO4_32836 [Corchorus olitorius]|uniref:F-box associated beta-propeller type 1 domain-containing protein n=1 Tax=Corchorus olitorius TaxID=93759 RepID=A0A1R3GXX2_9ROSI|nr:hypothetical protein COLO4_32836 [Corchorus olitorius]